jgi:hypothetical protein
MAATECKSLIIYSVAMRECIEILDHPPEAEWQISSNAANYVQYQPTKSSSKCGLNCGLVQEGRQKYFKNKGLNGVMAEAQGFEPWEDFHPRRFSRPVHSTTLPSLHERLSMAINLRSKDPSFANRKPWKSAHESVRSLPIFKASGYRSAHMVLGATSFPRWKNNNRYRGNRTIRKFGAQTDGECIDFNTLA